jgi:hypothetical protein
MRSYRFFFVSLDRSEPPHIHVRRENKVAKFWLDPVALERAGGFTACAKTPPCCHSERSEESRSAHFHEHRRFFVACGSSE